MAKVLVPLDATHASREALPLAEQIAREMSAEIVLVSVTELPETAEQAENARRDAAASLHKTASTLSSPVRERVEQSGDPVRGILQAIQEEQPDLVVIAKTEETGLSSLSERSITDELLRESRVPVRVVSANDGGATEA